MMYVILIIGFLLLVAGADLLVGGSIIFAKRTGISNFYVGMTITAIGTSVPIFTAAVFGGLKGVNQILVNDIAGANIFNLLVVLGICAMLISVRIERKMIEREFPFVIFVEILLLYMSADYLLHGKHANSIISRIDSVILLLLFCFFAGCTVRNIITEIHKKKAVAEVRFWKSLICIFLGIAIIKIGSDMVISCSSEICKLLGKNQKAISFLVRTASFNLPCFMACIAAIRRNQKAIILGNVTGSNIINVLFALGISCLINPVSLMRSYIYSLIVLCLVSILVWAFSYRGGRLNRRHGCAMVTLYVAYMIFQFNR